MEFCTIDSSGPKNLTIPKDKSAFIKNFFDNIVVDFNVSGSSGEEKFHMGRILNIDAGLQSAIITIEDIPQDRYGFIQGDRKLIITLLESSNSLLEII